MAYRHFVGEHIAGRTWRKPNDSVILGKNDFAVKVIPLLRENQELKEVPRGTVCRDERVG